MPGTLGGMTATSLALITGANKGIGFEVARQLGVLGMTVLVGARDAERGTIAERSLQDEGVDAHHVALDVTSQASVDQAVQQIGAEHGRLDVLVNNAGITGGPESGRPSQTPLATLRQVYETNVFGVVAVTNAMLPLLRQAPAGRIVNVSSEVGSVQATRSRRPDVANDVDPLPIVQDRAQHDHRAVRQGAVGHPHQGQRGQPRLLRHRPQ